MIAKRFLPIALVLAMAAFFIPKQANARVSVSFSFFYDQLSPYGSWVDVGGYGNCWRPARVSVGWQPYLDGEWLYTDYGWSWVSYDAWGGIPYHYGTWIFVEPYGWVWVPGEVWAPAWVTWCYGDGYIGWAPVPASFSVGYSGYFGDPVVLPASRYVVVPANRLVGVRVESARIDPSRNTAILPRTRKVTRFTSSRGIMRTSGPSVQEVERMGHTRIHRASASRLQTRPARFSTSQEHGRHLSVVMPSRARVRRMASRPSSAGARARGRATTTGHGNRPTTRNSHPRPPSPSRPSRRAQPHGRSAPPRRPEATRSRHETSRLHARTAARPSVRAPHERQAQPHRTPRSPQRRAIPQRPQERPAARRPPERAARPDRQPQRERAVRPTPTRRPQRPPRPQPRQRENKKHDDDPHGA